MNQPPTLRPPNVRRAVKSAAGFLLVCSVLWGLLESVYLAFPYTRAGADIIHEAKTDRLRQAVAGPSLFPASAKLRVMIFGTSRILAGFRPTLFDELLGNGVCSFNAGLPGDERFLDHLERALAAHDPPDVVLLTMPWSSTEPTEHDRVASGDGAVMDMLFPFRHMPRDSILFYLRSRGRGGIKPFYADAAQSMRQMIDARGYYFIEGQSHFEGNRLPDDFTLESDHSDVPLDRQGSPDAPQFKRLCRILSKHPVRVYYVPLCYRVHEAAPPTANLAWKTTLARAPHLGSIGPEYWQLPNRSFADPVHLNPEGAAEYTRRLAELLRPVLTRPTDNH